MEYPRVKAKEEMGGTVRMVWIKLTRPALYVKRIGMNKCEGHQATHHHASVEKKRVGTDFIVTRHYTRIKYFCESVSSNGADRKPVGML